MATTPQTRAATEVAHGVLDAMMLAAVRDVVNASDALRDACARHYGMAQSDVLALSHLTAFGSMTPSDLADLLRLTGASVTTLADRLDRAGLVRRVPHAFDRRRVVLEATELGRARVAAMRSLITRATADIPDPAGVSTVLVEVAARLQGQVAEVGRVLDELTPPPGD